MKFGEKWSGKGICAAAACALLGVAMGNLAATTTKDILTPYEDVKFPSPMINGNSMVAGSEALWRDPATGRFSSLVKFTKGSTNKHYHTFDYQLVVLKGTVVHWTQGLPDSGTKQLSPGSFWYQPANIAHQDSCLSDECMLFLSTFGGGDTKVVSDTK